MIRIVEVKTKKEQKDFLDFPLKMYNKNPYFVPPIYMDEKKIFSKKYVYYDTCEAIYFNAYKEGKMVGRISGIIQNSSNEKWNQKRVRFTRFDCIDDQEVADALFKKIEEWAKSKNMEEIVGPLGFSDLEREGLLIEGFDQLSTYEESYNYDYYQKLIENNGYVKDVDWVERKIFYPKNDNDRLEKFSALILKRFNLKVVNPKSVGQFIKHYGKQLFEILDITYENLYGTVPMTDNMRKMIISNFKLVVNPKQIAVIVDENDRVVCFGICIPSIAKALQKSKGHLTIPTLFKLLHSIKHPTVIDLCLVGVLPEYARKGVSSVLFAGFKEMLKDKRIQYAETNLNLEDNYNMINQWKNFDAILHKRRRCFIKKVS